jgi:hypothetical protein
VPDRAMGKVRSTTVGWLVFCGDFGVVTLT